MCDDPVEARTIMINFDEISALAGVGVRRAAAFLKLGLVGCEHPPENYALDGGVAYKFFADPASAEARDHIHSEYRAWIVASGLKELDHYFSLFLDRVWWSAELVHLHGTRVHSSYQFDDKFHRDTNVARKLESVAQKLDITIELDCFQSLSLARNCLAHAAGVVRARDTNADGVLEIAWVAPALVVLDGDAEIVYRAEPADMHKVKSEGGAMIEIRFDKRTAAFPVGSKISLTPHNLAEICGFYNIAASKFVEGLKGAVKAKGIVANTTASVA